MNTGLLTINNMLVPNAVAGTLVSKPAATPNTNQFALIQANNPPSTNAPETTTDNTPTGAQSEPINKSPQDFKHTFCKTVMTKTPQKTRGNTKSKKQSPTSGAFSKMNLAQPLSTQESAIVTAVLGKGSATKILLKPQAADKSVQLLADLKACKFSSVTGGTAKLTATKLGQMVPATSQGENKPISINQSQSGLKAVLPDVSKDPLTPDIQPLLVAGRGKNANKIQMLNKIVVDMKGLTNPQSSKELMPEAPTGDSKTTTAGEKPAMADKPAFSGSQKILVLNDGFPAVQDKSSDPQQKVTVGPEKSATVAEKTTDNKANAGQQGQVPIPAFAGTSLPLRKQGQNVAKWGPGRILSGLSHGDGKTQANNPSSDSILQKLNPTRVQISTNRTKDPRNSTSNNSSNSDSERILSTNNIQALVTEQSSAPSQAGKAANNTLPSDVSTSVSEQIQESIYSLLRQGNQQITIRLNPPELGKVFIKFQEQEDRITGLLEVSKMQTRYEIEQALPQIIRNLQDSGIQIKRLEVVLVDQSEQQAYKDQSLQNGWSQQHGSAEGNNPDNTPTNEWLANANSYQDNPEPQEEFITDDSINMLI